MKSRILPILVLLAVLVTACAPATSTDFPAKAVDVEPSATVSPALPTLDTSSQAAAEPTENLAPTVLPVATSRGPELEATDPSAVSLASGQLQLVEFFRFT